MSVAKDPIDFDRIESIEDLSSSISEIREHLSDLNVQLLRTIASLESFSKEAS